MKPKRKKIVPSSVPSVGGVYRVPLRRVYNKMHIKGDASWDVVYGKKKCLLCKQHFQEGDPYTVTNDHKYQHVECPGVKK